MRLFYLGIHKHRTAGAQVNGMRRKKSGLCEILYAVIQRFCKGFNKGTAAGRTGFIQLYAVHGLILDLNAFHVLSADVQNAVHLRIKECGSVIMCYGLHFAVIQKKSGFHQRFAIAGRTGAHNFNTLGEGGINLF